MTMTFDEIRTVRTEVAGWDPVGLTRADAGAVCRGLVGLAEEVARVQVLALVEAKAVGLLAEAGRRDVAGWLRAQGVAARSARTLGDAAWSVDHSPLVRAAVDSSAASVAHAAELRPVVDLVADGRGDDAEIVALLDTAREEPVEAFRKVVQGVVLRLRQHDHRPTSTIHESDADHGQKQLRALLAPDEHATVLGAIDRLVDERWRAGHPDSAGPDKHALPELRAAALVELARRSMRGDKGTRASTAEVIVVVDAETFLSGVLRPGSVCRLADGTPLHPTVVHQLANDAGLRCYAKQADGKVGLSETIRIAPVPLDLGRTRRLASRAQRLALAVDHTTCATCDAPFTHTRAHHRTWWEHGGRTDFANLLPECTNDHHLIHDRGWKLVPRPDGTWTLVPPADASATGAPPPAARPRPRRRVRGGRNPGCRP